jgi:hypothetical protein
VTIATRGEGPHAVIDGEQQSRLFLVRGHLRLIAVVLIRGASSTGGAIHARVGASVHVSGSMISDCTASSVTQPVRPPPHHSACMLQSQCATPASVIDGLACSRLLPGVHRLRAAQCTPTTV